MGQIFCVQFQREPLKFHTKYLTHTLKETIFIQYWKFRRSQIYELINVFETPPWSNTDPDLWRLKTSQCVIQWLHCILGIRGNDFLQINIPFFHTVSSYWWLVQPAIFHTIIIRSLTRWGWVRHCVNGLDDPVYLTFVQHSATSQYLNHCLLIVIWTTSNKF